MPDPKWKYAVRVKGRTVAYTTTEKEARTEAELVKGRVVSLIQPRLAPAHTRVAKPRRGAARAVTLAPNGNRIKVYYDRSGKIGKAVTELLAAFVSSDDTISEYARYPVEKALAKIGVGIESITVQTAEKLGLSQKGNKNPGYWRNGK